MKDVKEENLKKNNTVDIQTLKKFYKEKAFDGDISDSGSSHFYSFQKQCKNYTAFTIYSYNEDAYFTGIYWLNYDKNKKLKGQLCVAGEGGDGSDAWSTSSTMENDTTLIVSNVVIDDNEELEGTSKTYTTGVDSTVEKYIISTHGIFTKVSSRSFDKSVKHIRDSTASSKE